MDKWQSRLKQIPFKVGAVKDELVMHPRYGELTGMLSASLITRREIGRSDVAREIIEDCVERANRLVLDEFPELNERIGEIHYSEIIDDLCDVLNFFQTSWYLSRELYANDDPRMFGV